jgi:hypothetical protein
MIAMQFEITDQAAIAFASGFYAALADGYPVDAALAQARKAIHAAGHGLEWGTPVLYLRSRDGVVFEPEARRMPDLRREDSATNRSQSPRGVRVFSSATVTMTKNTAIGC